MCRESEARRVTRHDPFRRAIPSARNCRTAAGTAMTAHGDNDTSAQPQFTQWGRLGEILGGVQFSWSSTARCRLVMPEPPKDEADEDPLSKMLRERAERRKA